MVFEPGDIVVGDSDGVLCVPLDEAEEVLAKAKAKHEVETNQLKRIAEGKNDRSWVDAALKAKGCLPT